MTIDIENIAKISTAKVDVSGITVLAGPNGSGKSTISRALMSASSLALHMTKLMDISRISSIFELIERLFADLRIPFDMYRDWCYVDDEIWKPLLVPGFWMESTPFLLWCKKYFVRTLDGPTIGYMMALSPAKVKAVKERWPIFSEGVLSRIAAKDSDHARNAAEDVVSRAFAGQAKPLGRRTVSGRIKLSDKDSSLSITFKAGEVATCSMGGTMPISSLFYIEPSNQLDFFSAGPWMSRHHVRDEIDRYTALEYCYYNVINLDKPALMTMEEKRQWRLTCACLERILKKIGGRLDKQSHQLFFNEDRNDSNLSISLQNVASGIKSIASVCRAIEMNALKANGLLIIDEPESNLHPDWQVAVAEFLVSLHIERGIKVLINTHSPYMLRALRHFEKKSGRNDVCAFYQMIEGPKGFVADPVTNKVDVLFQDLFAPFEMIMRD